MIEFDFVYVVTIMIQWFSFMYDYESYYDNEVDHDIIILFRMSWVI